MIYICILLYALIAPFSYTFGNTEVSSEMTVTVNIRNKDRTVPLQSSEYFADKNTKVWLAERVGDKFTYTLQDDIIKKANKTFYEEKLNDDTNSEDYENFDPSDFEENADIDKKPQTTKISKISEDDDYNFDSSSFYDNEENDEKPIQKKNEPEIKENTVYPEILVYVDKTIFEHFNYDIVKTVAYTLVFWSGVDFKFRHVLSPIIRLNIAGIVVLKDQLLPNEKFQINRDVHNKFSKHMFSHEKFIFEKDYDIAVWLAGSTNLQTSEQAKSIVAGACHKLPTMLASVAIILDDFKLSGIATAAHELAHLFGAANDGEQLKIWSGPGSKNCSASDGYLMSTQRHGNNAHFFSKCTRKAIEYFFSTNRSNCLKNNRFPHEIEEPVLRILPSLYLTLDQQCEKGGYKKAFEVTPEICTNIKCLTKENNAEYINVTALPGTPCDVGKYCMMGHCLGVTFNKNKYGMSSELLFAKPYEKLPLKEDEVTTPAVEVTTSAVVETTPAVVETTPTVVETTPIVLETTSAVEVTTPTVVETTPAVEVTTPIVLETTPAVEVTTPIVLETTPAVEVTTPIVLETTPAVEVTTPTVVEITPAVEVTTPTVVETTPAVEVSTPAVVETTPTVVETTPAVKVSTPAVVETTPTVVETTPAVIETTPVVKVTTPAVVETTPRVVEITPAVKETKPFDKFTTPLSKVTTPKPKKDDKISDRLKLADNHCEMGRCVKNVEENPKVIPLSPEFKLADKECIKAGTYGAVNVSQNQCILNCKVSNSFYLNIFRGCFEPMSFRIQTMYAKNGFACSENSHCENGQCIPNQNKNSLLNSQFEWAEQHCKNHGFLGALKVSAHDCFLKCKMAIYSIFDYFTPQKTCQVSIFPMAAPNKFPCSYKGVCLNNICVQVAYTEN
ncbi:uncharacterized protein LOC127280918 [Leptopilina boulardi]|uniref:uncharacterized protein LOC127280918 n=1 Tax=Leptopilina boulardi TaxID=63433 RepID=UPI0021F64583|nr:uncharacterized protein LOC127280918 [Leptopilina boulardi]XP_051160274.1 uncharacterized protein LOC127280918 [Leptopilina boulardi]